MTTEAERLRSAGRGCAGSQPRTPRSAGARRGRFLAVPLLAAMLLAAAPGRAASRELSFEDRVAAQEKIERVLYAHQEGSRAPFAEAVPRDVIEAKVRDTLERSALLET